MTGSRCGMNTRRKPEVTKRQLEEAFEADKSSGRLRWRMDAGNGRPGRLAGGISKYGVIIRFCGHQYNIGEFIWCIAHGTTPPHGVEFIDGNPMNWSIGNLREVGTSRRSAGGIVPLPAILRRIESTEDRLKVLLRRMGQLKADLKEVIAASPGRSAIK